MTISKRMRNLLLYTRPRNTWATRLAGLITCKARSAYSRLSPTDSLDYDKARQAILKRYELTPEACRTKVRASHKGSDETFAEWGVRASQLFDRWVEGEEVDQGSYEKFRGLLIREQLLKNSPAELAVWLCERKPKPVEELTELADHYLATHKANSQSDGTSCQKSGSSNGKPGPKGALEKASDGKQSGGKAITTLAGATIATSMAIFLPNAPSLKRRERRTPSLVSFATQVEPRSAAVCLFASAQKWCL